MAAGENATQGADADSDVGGSSPLAASDAVFEPPTGGDGSLVKVTLAERAFELISVGVVENRAMPEHRRVRKIVWILLGVGLLSLAWGGLRVFGRECANTEIEGLPGFAFAEWGTALSKCPVPGHDSGWLLVSWDWALIAGYVLVGTLILAAGWWRYEAEMMRRGSWVILLPAAAAVLGFIGSALAEIFAKPDLSALRTEAFGPRALETLLLTVLWLNWLCVAAMIVVTVMSASVWIVRRRDPFPHSRFDDDTAEEASEAGSSTTSAGAVDDHDVGAAPDGREEVVGVCVSGGGIRSAAFALGVLSQLEPGGSPAPTVADLDRSDGPTLALDLLAAGRRPVTRTPATTIEDPAHFKDLRHAVDQPAEDDDPELHPHRQRARNPRLMAGRDERANTDPWGPLGHARYLCAVSGGAWASTSWTLQTAFETPVRQPNWVHANSADIVIQGLRSRSRWSLLQRQKYLLNSKRGLSAALGWVVFSALTNVVYLYSLIFVVAWPLGWFLGRPAVAGDRTTAGVCATDPVLPEAFLPSVGLACLGVFVFLLCGLSPRFLRLWPLGAALLGLATLSATYLAALPMLFTLMPQGDCTRVAWVAVSGAVSATLAVSIGGIVWKVIGGPLLHQVTDRIERHWMRLLGVLLGFTFTAWAVVVMFMASTNAWTAETLIGPLILIGLISLTLGPNWPSLHNIFAKRLRSSFDPTAGIYSDTATPVLSMGRTWEELEHCSQPNEYARVPELVMCCSQQRNGIALGGLRAETFTISPRWIRQGKRVVKRSDYLALTSKVRRWGRGREYRDLDMVAPWMATSGAAFASAMGRSSLGSTNALLAASNADLGMWLPNVIPLQEAGLDGTVAPDEFEPLPRPRMGYMLKEILGWYSKRDRYVFVTDGGHWDNLGLVELLRRRCNVIYAIDASADPPGSFAALRQALALATLELDGFAEADIDIEKDLEDLKPTAVSDSGEAQGRGAPPNNITTLTIPRTLDDGSRVSIVIHYVKLQSCQAMSNELRRFAIADSKFPMYSTMKQFLSPKQFDNLVDIGKDAGRRLRKRHTAWLTTGNLRFPYAAEVSGQYWVLRADSACAEHPLYTLFVNGREVGTRNGVEADAANRSSPELPSVTARESMMRAESVTFGLGALRRFEQQRKVPPCSICR